MISSVIGMKKIKKKKQDNIVEKKKRKVLHTNIYTVKTTHWSVSRPRARCKAMHTNVVLVS